MNKRAHANVSNKEGIPHSEGKDESDGNVAGDQKDNKKEADTSDETGNPEVEGLTGIAKVSKNPAMLDNKGPSETSDEPEGPEKKKFVQSKGAEGEGLTGMAKGSKNPKCCTTNLAQRPVMNRRAQKRSNWATRKGRKWKD